jgi:D-alanyl-D-alanine carboxypeptidase
MKTFFYTFIGGLTAVSTGVLLSYGAIFAWRHVVPDTSFLKSDIVTTIASAISTDSADGTVVNGLVRKVSYSASEEEDIINSALYSLPRTADKKVTASAYIVKNISRGEVSTEYNADTLFPIASITKLVTAVVARRLIAPNEHIVMTKTFMATYGNTAQFVVGETLRADDLLYPLLIVSSNDAAEALAQFSGRKKFISAMNEFAQEIGAYKTYFADPSGLSPQNVSTAQDLAIILKWIYENDRKVIDITAIRAKTIRAHTWINPTHFLNWTNYIGGKNGYIPEANRTAASLFTVGKYKNVYAVVILGSDTRDVDELRLLDKINKDK